MTTEAEIEAASLAIIDYLDEFHPAPEGFLYTALARDALTAAEEVRGQVSEDDWSFLKWIDDLLACKAIPEYEDVERLLALARRGAGQAVPDEAAIRADERERCAKIAENWMALFDPAIGPRLAASIRAAAPKPEDKP